MVDSEYSIVFKNVDKSYGSTKVIENLNLGIRRGERLILLGPSGCGKTTTLRMIAGFEDITAGELYMDGKLVNDLQPGERNIAMVFQSYALFPHLTVWDNITFSLQLKKMLSAEIAERAHEALSILHLEGYEKKKIHELSGGQKQRVALGRAIVKRSPYFLLDEPLSNLDAQLRQQARTELVRLHDMFKSTMLYVTHNQIEAMTVADRIAIMNKGEIQQIDTPERIYRSPANVFVATFVGSPAMNIVKAQYDCGKLVIGDSVLSVPEPLRGSLEGRLEVLFGLRPEDCRPLFGEAQGEAVHGFVEYLENTGNLQTASFKLPDGQSFYLQSSDQSVSLRQAAAFSFDWGDVSFFDPISEKSIG